MHLVKADSLCPPLCFKARQGRGSVPLIVLSRVATQLPWHPMGRSVSRLLRNLPPAGSPLGSGRPMGVGEM